jgi:hypothetical protein
MVSNFKITEKMQCGLKLHKFEINFNFQEKRSGHSIYYWNKWIKSNQIAKVETLSV